MEVFEARNHEKASAQGAITYEQTKHHMQKSRLFHHLPRHPRLSSGSSPATPSAKFLPNLSTPGPY
eukprot:763053-Hanusia_phi.AAC.1